jgi:hypothetical protein
MLHGYILHGSLAKAQAPGTLDLLQVRTSLDTKTQGWALWCEDSEILGLGFRWQHVISGFHVRCVAFSGRGQLPEPTCK